MALFGFDLFGRQPIVSQRRDGSGWRRPPRSKPSGTKQLYEVRPPSPFDHAEQLDSRLHRLGKAPTAVGGRQALFPGQGRTTPNRKRIWAKSNPLTAPSPLKSNAAT